VKKDTSHKLVTLNIAFLRAGFFLFMAAFVVACATVYYVLSDDQDMEWLRTRIESTLNERSNGELTFRLEGAKIAVEKGQGAHLLMSGLSVIDRQGNLI